MTRLRILPAAGARRTVAVAALALVLASGCALDAEREAQPDAGAEASIVTTVAEPSPSDPFAAVDEAFRRLALDRAEVEPSQPTRIWDRLVSRFEFPSCRDGDAADRWAHWYADNPEYMQRVFARAQPWLHDIANEVEARGLPGEYALLPVVESAFDPFAHSRESATGPWQFMHGTARDYGLPINDWYDGRRDFVAATSAALDYLSDLVAMFDGDLALALAAYNAGQGRVQRLMRRNRARGLGTEWHELALPRETRGYIPKLAGLGCLVRDPVRYAFRLPDMADAPRVRTVELPGSVDLVSLAVAAGLDVAELVSLNAGLNRHRTPPAGPHYVVVPVEHAERVESVLTDLPPPPAPTWEQVRVRSGDTLSGLAARHGTSTAELRRINDLDGDFLRVGQALKLPRPVTREPDASADPAYASVYAEFIGLQQQLLPTNRLVHRVRPGESLWVIARRYGVSVAELQRMNGLSRSLIRPGQRLVIDTGRRVDATAPAPRRVVVRQGDSLWRISRRYGVALDDLIEWNGLDAGSVLRVGQELVLRGGDA